MCSCDVSVKFQNEELFRPREEWARADKTHSLRKHLLSIESPYSKLGSTPIFLPHYCDLLLLYFLVRLRKSSILILILVRWTELTSTLKLSRD